MKVQDLAFVLLLLFVLWRRNDKLAIIIGVFCLLLAIPLFKFWIFFTAERLTWYAAAFFTYGIALQLIAAARGGRPHSHLRSKVKVAKEKQ